MILDYSFMRRGALAALILLGACDGDEGSGALVPHELNGELGRGDFEYLAIDDSDAMLDPSALPAAIAVGARFDLDFTAAVALAASGVSVHSGSAFVSTHGATFEVDLPGRFVMLAIHQGHVVDLAHLTSRPVSDVVVEDTDGYVLTELTLAVGEVAELRALPLDDEARLLAGALQYDWTTDDASVVEVRGAGLDPRRVMLTAHAPGMVDVQVRTGEATERLSVLVLEESADTMEEEG